MLQELTADEWEDWLVHYHRQPWGEHRSDLRQEALIGTLAAPLMPDDYRFPSPLYPYDAIDDDAPHIDHEATLDGIRALRTRLYEAEDSISKRQCSFADVQQGGDDRAANEDRGD